MRNILSKIFTIMSRLENLLNRRSQLKTVAAPIPKASGTLLPVKGKIPDINVAKSFQAQTELAKSEDQFYKGKIHWIYTSQQILDLQETLKNQWFVLTIPSLNPFLAKLSSITKERISFQLKNDTKRDFTINELNQNGISIRPVAEQYIDSIKTHNSSRRKLVH